MKAMVAQSQNVSIEESDDELLDMLLDEAIPTDTGFPDGVMSVTDTIAQQAVYPETHPVLPPNNNENDGQILLNKAKFHFFLKKPNLINIFDFAVC
jgi:hypothetical protein